MRTIWNEVADSETSNLALGIPFTLRLAGTLLVGAALMLMPQISKAATVSETVPATQKSCMRSMDALIDGSLGSANRLEITTPSSTSTMARIFVSDGEVQIVCDASRHQMKISRILASMGDAHANQLAMSTPK